MPGRVVVPRAVVVLAALLVLAPALLWLVVAADTRPVDRAEVAADRAHVESTAEYAERRDTCLSLWSGRVDCDDVAYDLTSDLDREPPELRPAPWNVPAFALVSMAGTSLLIGLAWPAGAGVRALLRRTALIAAGAWLVTAEAGAIWWWTMQHLATARGLDLVVGDQTWSFVRYAALLAALAGVAGASLAGLLHGWLRGVLGVAVGAVAVGATVLLVGPPTDPWLPHVNAEAFLFDGADYEGPPGAEVCGEPLEVGRLWVVPGLGAHAPAAYCSRDATLTTGTAAAHLGGAAGLLLLGATAVAAVTSRGRRGA